MIVVYRPLCRNFRKILRVAHSGLLVPVTIKYERKLIGTSVRVFVSTYVCISMIVYGTLYEYRTVGIGFCQNHFRLHFNLKK